MKLPKSLLIKDTTSLFMDKYKYKIVLVSPAASWFRNKKLDLAEKRLLTIKIDDTSPWSHIRTLEDRNYCDKLIKTLKGFNDNEYDIRVQNPLVNVYTNNKSYIETLAAINEIFTKYVCLPNRQNPELIEGVILVKNLDYDYKVYLGTTRKKHDSFVQWASDNDKVKITNRCAKDLYSSYSSGGGYFYVKGEKTLTMVKMFLGSDICKIKKVTKA